MLENPFEVSYKYVAIILNINLLKSDLASATSITVPIPIIPTDAAKDRR